MTIHFCRSRCPPTVRGLVRQAESAADLELEFLRAPLKVGRFALPPLLFFAAVAQIRRHRIGDALCENPHFAV